MWSELNSFILDFLNSNISALLQSTMSTIRDDSIRTIADESLQAALIKIGDGSGLVFSSHENELEEYQDITSSIVGYSSLDYITSFLRKGKSEAISKDRIKTTISWTQSSCICLDTNCKSTGAIDIIGAWESDNGQMRGETPLLLLDDDGQSHLPCLSHSKLPPISELDVVGCNWNATKNGEMIEVFQCGPDSVENLKFIIKETGKTVARSLSKKEIVPQLSEFGPDLKMTDIVNSPSLEIEESIVEYPVTFFEGGTLEFDYTFYFDIAPVLNTAKRGLILTLFNALGEGVRDEDFNPNNPASEATLAEIVRVSDSFSNHRLLSSVSYVESFVEATVRASPLYMALEGSRPESSAPQEIVSGVALLAIACCGFGAFSRTYIKNRTTPKLFAVAASLLVLLLEIVAFYLRWNAESDKNNFNESMVFVEVAGADRFDGLLPLSAGKDGKTFIANTFVVELKDDSYDYTWVFISGTIASVSCLFLSYWLDPELME